MPARQLETGYVDWTGKDVPIGGKDAKAYYHTHPFALLDAAIIPTKYGKRPYMLIQECNTDGTETFGDPVVLVLPSTEKDGKPGSRERTVLEVQQASLEGDWIGPLILADFDTGNELGNDFITMRNYEPSAADDGKAAVKEKAGKAAKPSANVTEAFDPGDIPF